MTGELFVYSPLALPIASKLASTERDVICHILNCVYEGGVSARIMRTRPLWAVLLEITSSALKPECSNLKGMRHWSFTE